MNAKHAFKLWVLGLCGMATLAVTPIRDVTPAFAHGERSQEPFLRMRTVNWYDTEWVGKSTKVNDVTELRGKFHLSEDWPRGVVKPVRTFINVGSPSSVFLRLSSKVNGTPMFVSGPMEIGRDYEYVVTLKARLPGHHHIHPMYAVKDAGPIAGPGGWMDITGRYEDFTNPIKTMTGETFDSETKGTATGIMWHLLASSVAEKSLIPVGDDSPFVSIGGLTVGVGTKRVWYCFSSMRWSRLGSVFLLKRSFDHALRTGNNDFCAGGRWPQDAYR